MANSNYTCHKPKCHITVETPYCPICNDFLSPDVHVCESIMKPLAPPAGPLDFCTAFGHWGDVFCCVGVMRALMAHTGQERVNVLYVGPDMEIVDWLEAQPFIGEVVGVKVTDEQGRYSQFWQATIHPDCIPEQWLGVLYGFYRGLPDAKRFTQTHINQQWFQTKDGLPAQLWHDPVIPDDTAMRAWELLTAALPVRMSKVYHLHPVSTMSEAGHNHWPHWLAAIEWLVERTPHTYVLTGLHEIPYVPRSPRLINLVGKTKTNLDVLAISEMCDGVISTPNNVAIWSVMRQQRCLCVGNKATEFLSSYYRRFLQRGENLTYCNVDTPFSAFQAAACAFFEAGEQ